MRLPTVESLALISAPFRFARKTLSSGGLELPETFKLIFKKTGVNTTIEYENENLSRKAVKKSKTIILTTHTGNGFDTVTALAAIFDLAANNTRILMDKQFIKILQPHERYRNLFCSIPNVETQNKRFRIRTLVTAYQQATSGNTTAHDRWTGWLEAKRGKESVVVFPDGGQKIGDASDVVWPKPLENLTITADNLIFVHADRTPFLSMLFFVNPSLIFPIGWLLTNTFVKSRAVVSAPIAPNQFNDIAHIQAKYYEWAKGVSRSN